ncbi:MAG: hypothetical protein ACPLPR_02085 [Bacillota bacterium]
MGRVAALVTGLLGLHAVLEEFLLSTAAGGAAERTLEDYTYHLNRFPHCGWSTRDYHTLQKAAVECLTDLLPCASRDARFRKLRGFFT